MFGHPLGVVESWFRFKVDELQKIAGQKKTAGVPAVSSLGRFFIFKRL
jgi:hypothetical protein